MTIIAIISDIHANLSALKAVLRKINSMNVDEIWCNGDIVGYYTEPSETLNLVKSTCHSNIIKGNHDHAAAIGIVPEHFNYAAAYAINWTSLNLTMEERAFLYCLPTMKILEREGKRLLMVHGTIEYPLDEYMKNDQQVLDQYIEFLDLLNIDILFTGHTHVPFTYKADNRTIVTSGSVGQPRDNDPRANFSIYDTNNEEIYFHNVEYDYSPAVEGIEENHLPQILAKRLSRGV